MGCILTTLTVGYVIIRIDSCLYDLECMFQNYRGPIVLVYVITSAVIIEHISMIEFIEQDNIKRGFVLLGDRPPTVLSGAPTFE